MSGNSTPEQRPPFGVAQAGGYQPTQNEQRHINDLLMVHALRKIKFALQSLKSKFAQSRSQRLEATTEESGQISPVDSEPDDEVIQQLFDNLDRTVNSVVNAVRTRNSIAPHNFGEGPSGGL